MDTHCNCYPECEACEKAGGCRARLKDALRYIEKADARWNYLKRYLDVGRSYFGKPDAESAKRMEVFHGAFLEMQRLEKERK